MPTWYMDYENGTDANASIGNGDSFATRRKRIDNFVAAAIAPGDEIRIMGSPAPTLLGNATWTDGPLPATQSITSSTNATPIVVTRSAHGYANGDTVIVSGHNTNTNANGVWTIANVTANTFELVGSVGNGVGSGGTVRKFTNAVVTLASPVTQNIALCGNSGTKPNWTASANVTCTVNTSDYKEGAGSQEIAVGASFTTGKAAYLTLPATLNLSSYQQVSAWVKQTVGTVGIAGDISLRLCTDATGDVSVHTIDLGGMGSLNQWKPIIWNNAAALNSGINSVAIYVDVDRGAVTYRIDNIIACKAASAADSLNLTSLISKDPGNHTFGDGYECWFGIQSINGTRVVLDGAVNSIPGATPQRGYSGTTETVATYKRETIKTIPASSSVANVQVWVDSGTAENLITYSGGWNRTDMSTQTLETWFDGQNGLGRGISNNVIRPFNSFDKVNTTRYTTGFFDSGANDITIVRMEVCNTGGIPISVSSNRLTATTLSAVCCGGAITPGTAAVVQTVGRADSTTSGNGVTTGNGSWIGVVKSASNCANGGVSSGIGSYIGELFAANNNAQNYSVNNRSVCGNLVSVGSTGGNSIGTSSTSGWMILGGSSNTFSNCLSVTTGSGTLRNFTINEANEVSGFTDYGDGRVYSENHDGVAGNTRIFCDGGLIATDSTVTHGDAAYSWKFSPTSTNRSEYYPLNQAIAQIAVAANSLVMVKTWFRRDNTALTGRLVCKGGQLAGVSSDVITSMTAAINTWEELSITFTPTESGVIEIEAQFYGGTTHNGWVSDLTVEQA